MGWALKRWHRAGLGSGLNPSLKARPWAGWDGLPGLSWAFDHRPWLGVFLKSWALGPPKTGLGPDPSLKIINDMILM